MIFCGGTRSIATFGRKKINVINLKKKHRLVHVILEKKLTSKHPLPYQPPPQTLYHLLHPAPSNRNKIPRVVFVLAVFNLLGSLTCCLVDEVQWATWQSLSFILRFSVIIYLSLVEETKERKKMWYAYLVIFVLGLTMWTIYLFIFLYWFRASLYWQRWILLIIMPLCKCVADYIISKIICKWCHVRNFDFGKQIQVEKRTQQQKTTTAQIIALGDKDENEIIINNNENNISNNNIILEEKKFMHYGFARVVMICFPEMIFVFYIRLMILTQKGDVADFFISLVIFGAMEVMVRFFGVFIIKLQWLYGDGGLSDNGKEYMNFVSAKLGLVQLVEFSFIIQTNCIQAILSVYWKKAFPMTSLSGGGVELCLTKMFAQLVTELVVDFCSVFIEKRMGLQVQDFLFLLARFTNVFGKNRKASFLFAAVVTYVNVVIVAFLFLTSWLSMGTNCVKTEPNEKCTQAAVGYQLPSAYAKLCAEENNQICWFCCDDIICLI